MLVGVSSDTPLGDWHRANGWKLPCSMISGGRCHGTGATNGMEEQRFRRVSQQQRGRRERTPWCCRAAPTVSSTVGAVTVDDRGWKVWHGPPSSSCPSAIAGAASSALAARARRSVRVRCGRLDRARRGVCLLWPIKRRCRSVARSTLALWRGGHVTGGPSGPRTGASWRVAGRRGARC